MSKKKPKATKMQLSEFVGASDAGGDLAWAEDEQWGDDTPAPQNAGDKAKFFGFKVGSMEDFRNAPTEQLSTVVPPDMEAPFTAHIGNLPNAMTEQELTNAFVEYTFNVLSVHIVHRAKSTFGYVEFESREELQRAILQTGRNLGGRKIKVDVATQQQLDRLKNAGQETQSVLSRDAMNQEQPEFKGMGGRMRSTGSFQDISRDHFSSESAPERGFGGGTVEDLGDFRSSTVAQPPPPPSLRQWSRGSKPASPNSNTAPDFGSWRDEKRELPAAGEGTGSWRKPPPKADKPAEAESTSSWRTEVPAPAKMPEERSWRDEPRVQQASPATAPAPTLDAKKVDQKKSKPPQPQTKAAPPPKPQPASENRFSILRK